MIITCLDSCCAINLVKSNIFNDLCINLKREFYIQGLVEDELNEVDGLAGILLTRGHVKPISGDAVFASEVGQIAGPYNIGLGEAECIAIAKKYGHAFASDDGRARKVAGEILGQTNVIGTLGLLTEAVKTGVLSHLQVSDAYREMRVRGAFLPALPPDYFARV